MMPLRSVILLMSLCLNDVIEVNLADEQNMNNEDIDIFKVLEDQWCQRGQ